MTVKSETKLVTEAREVLTYVAEDGVEFDTREGCMGYEACLRAARKAEEEREIKEAFEQLVIKKFAPDNFCIYDTETYICKLNSEADFNVVDKWCENQRCEMDYLDRPKAYPCRYIFTVDSSNYACTEPENFMEWARDILKILDETKI